MHIDSESIRAKKKRLLSITLIKSMKGDRDAEISVTRRWRVEQSRGFYM